MTFFKDNGLKVHDMACGWQFTTCLTKSNEIYTWGSGQFGQLGYDQQKTNALPRKISFEGCGAAQKKIVDIRVGFYTGVCLMSDGTAYGWGKIGDKTDVSIMHKTPVKIEFQGDPKIRYICCGGSYVYYITQEDQIISRGLEADTKARFIELFKDKKVDYVTSGSYHSFVHLKDGRLYGIGSASWGELTEDVKTETLKPVLLTNRILTENRIIKFCDSSIHSLAFLETKESDLEIASWGHNAYGECGTGIVTDRHPVKLVNFFKEKAMPIKRRFVIWSPETHNLFPPEFRAIVVAVMILASHNNNGSPNYPFGLFWMLPKEIIFLVFVELGKMNW
eukprot:TRINITY_DN2833_c0_g1_i1.p1 TRINITY_DN2833_c0_g1~~TRINITY_DN2833_c0_g1_i1.p1  ORF type:complete len:367 (+),score=50.55 TRINITY_DN2833_c0_g1_i1:97-1101(+)